MKRHVERQRGAILVMTVLFLVILLGFAALALDLGRLYVLRTEMQNAADAAGVALWPYGNRSR
jgi:Flp pilus assembly protein TadG